MDMGIGADEIRNLTFHLGTGVHVAIAMDWSIGVFSCIYIYIYVDNDGLER